MKILLCTPCAGGFVRYEYMQSVLTQVFCAPDRLLHQDQFDVALYLAGGASGLGRDRAVMASYALRNNFDRLFFIDSDQDFTWDQFRAIATSEHPICAGVVPMKMLPFRLNFTPMEEDRADCFSKENETITTKGLELLVAKYPEQKEIRVCTTGTAFLSVDVKVLATLTKTIEKFKFVDPNTQKTNTCWDFFPSGPLGGIYLGEDWGFCTIAQRAGFPIHINPAVKIPHIGTYTYDIDNPPRL